jgi:hypothetical protein
VGGGARGWEWRRCARATVLGLYEGSREKAARKENALRAILMSELKLRPPKRRGFACDGRARRRSFVANCAPLDDGQGRFRWQDDSARRRGSFGWRGRRVTSGGRATALQKFWSDR